MEQVIMPIAHSYWRRILAGAKVFSTVPSSVAGDVMRLAQQDVVAGKITPEAYAQLIGEAYTEVRA